MEILYNWLFQKRGKEEKGGEIEEDDDDDNKKRKRIIRRKEKGEKCNSQPSVTVNLTGGGEKNWLIHSWSQSTEKVEMN